MEKKDKNETEMKKAIINEISAQRLYSRLAKIIYKEIPKGRILAILRDEKEHEADLRKYYLMIYGKEVNLSDMKEPSFPEISAELETTRQVLEFAILEEIKAADDYGRYAKETSDEEARTMFKLLHKMELEHRNILQQELDNLTLGMDWFTIDKAMPMEE